MTELDGKTYTIKTPGENTSDMITRINTYCANNDIRNSKNEVIYIDENFASPFYMILWAMGYLVTIIQNLIYGVGKALSVQSSSDAQLLNLADLAGIHRGTPSRTTFSILVKAMAIDNPEYDATSPGVTITSEDTITYDGIVYAPALHPSIHLEPNQIAYITLVAQESGSYTISAGMITEFDSPISNIEYIQQDTSIPGQEQESIASLRNRMQRRQISGTNLDTAMDAIRALDGVTTCNIYYNESVTETRSIGADSIPVPPRQALILVQGYNSQIAKAFFSNLTCASIPSTSVPADRLLDAQVYTTHANQELQVALVKPKLVPIYIRIILGIAIDKTVELAIKDAILALAREVSIGMTLTAAMVLNALDDYTSYSLQGALLSANNSSWDYKATPAIDAIWTFIADNITIEVGE